MDPDPNAFSMQKSYAAPKDWDANRETITRLYLEENRTLQEVMDYMASCHSFFATVKMYRTRIRQWGIDKNHKASEVAYMVRLKQRRDALGKGSVFFVRNRRVDWDDVERYLSRNPKLQRELADNKTNEETQVEDIVCRTPSPKPRVTQKLNAPEELRVHEDILLLFRDYTQGAFENGIWKLSPDHNRYFGSGGVEANARLNSWYDKVRNVADWPGRDADAVRLINYLLDDLPQFVRDQDHTLFHALMRACFYLSSRKPTLGREFLLFIASLCEVTLGKHHPMALAWARLKDLSVPEFLLVVQGTAKARFDFLLSHLDGSLGNDNVVNALREYLFVLRLRGPGEVNELNQTASWAQQRVIVLDKETLSGAQLRLLLNIANCYIARQQLEHATEVLDRVAERLAGCSTQTSYWQRITATYLFLRGFLAYITGRTDQALGCFLETHNILERVAGSCSSAVADSLLALIDFPGLIQDSEQLAQWRLKFEEVQTQILVRAQSGVRHAPTELIGVWDGPMDTDVNTLAW